MPLPITDKTRCDISVAVEKEQYSQSLFGGAVAEVCRYLEAHQFARFQLSTDYSRVVALLQQVAEDKPERIKLIRRGSIHLQPELPTSVTSFRDIMGSQACTRFFKEYCTRMYCSENLYFWMDAENYSNVPGNDYRRSIARRLFKVLIQYELLDFFDVTVFLFL